MTNALYIFNADVWGTVSDWTMVSITLVTAIFLYKTLQSQSFVQKTLSELYNIERVRFRESIKPGLRYFGSTDKMKPASGDKKILTIEVKNVTSSNAIEIERIVSEGKHSQQIFIPMGFSDRRNHLAKDDEPLLFHFLVDKSPYVNFTLKYQDIAGTKYAQNVFCICDDSGLEIHPSLPEIS